MTGQEGAVSAGRASRPRRKVVLLIQVAKARRTALAEAVGARHHLLVADAIGEALTALRATIPDLVVIGSFTLETGVVVEKLQGSYARGMRPQLVTDDPSADVNGVPRWLELLAGA